MERFLLSSPQVVRLRASQANDNEAEPHTLWHVSYEPDPVEGLPGTYLSVIGSLHAANATGWGDISVGALLHVLEDVPDEKLEEELKSSDAIETLYDIARSHLGPLLNTVDCDLSLARKAPEVELARYTAEPAKSADEPDDGGGRES